MIFDLKYNKKNAILELYSIFLIWIVFKNLILNFIWMTDFEFHLNIYIVIEL